MQFKNLSRRTILLAGLIGCSFFLGFILYFNFKGSVPSSSVPPSEQQEKLKFGLPMRLKIPGINVDASVESVGLTSGGDMDIPKGPDDVAWYNLGPHPGEEGSAVIAGHYGTWKNGKGSVFDNLHKLSGGDKIYIEDDKGNNIVFVVRESRSYNPGADASDVFSSNDGTAHLNLITCEGIWNKDSKSYSKRLIVFADKE